MNAHATPPPTHKRTETHPALLVPFHNDVRRRPPPHNTCHRSQQHKTVIFRCQIFLSRARRFYQWKAIDSWNWEGQDVYRFGETVLLRCAPALFYFWERAGGENTDFLDVLSHRFFVCLLIQSFAVERVLCHLMFSVVLMALFDFLFTARFTWFRWSAVRLLVNLISGAIVFFQFNLFCEDIMLSRICCITSSHEKMATILLLWSN
jgi:hypothetical protein